MRRMNVRRLATATGLGLVLALTSADPAAAQGTEVVDAVTGVVGAVVDTVIGVIDTVTGVIRGLVDGLTGTAPQNPSSGG
ncbi:hypothetical protein [Streptomyces ureilyticus]|uniref:Secreted protein n=1 Tax=Streptomyces ureilyticus TaxID=1775131 RepID=A0ABX0DZD6_9ACTN|nr:hypothetical protein [Streptomyces ureilyticus]NGO46575.1 hypothetical protein [Streptomyces ureilyticus]